MSDAPGDVDHAFIMVEDVEQALEDCARKRVAVASIYSNGFADAGREGEKRQKRLVERARKLGVRLLGPNSMGVVNLTGHVALTVNAVLEMDEPTVGGTSLVSQSGTMLGTLLSRGAARGLGYAKLISVGNEADLGVGELVDLLVADADTKVIALFLETVRDAAPEVILASWCGKKVAHARIRARDGWGDIPAVRDDRIVEIKSPIILQPGPAALTDGLDAIVKALWA